MFWLRSTIHHIQSSCGFQSIREKPTTLYEDNTACITQIKAGFIKGDRTKHISPKFFHIHELQETKEIDVSRVCSSENLADLFTKALPKTTFEKLVYGIGMRRLYSLSGGASTSGGVESRLDKSGGAESRRD